MLLRSFCLEELRRNGDYTESVEARRTGLAIHPTSLRALTFRRAALVSTNWTKRKASSKLVPKSAPEVLAALRARRRLACARARTRTRSSYRSALLLARNDPDLQQTVDELSRKVEPQLTAASAEPLSFDQTAQELTLQPPPAAETAFSYFTQATEDLPLHTPAEPLPEIVPDIVEPAIEMPAAAPPVADIWASLTAPAPMAETPAEDIAAREKAVRTIAALEQWLEAIHVARAQRRA